MYKVDATVLQKQSVKYCACELSQALITIFISYIQIKHKGVGLHTLVSYNVPVWKIFRR